MKSYLDCIPCFFRQSLEAVRLVSDDPKAHEALLRTVAVEISTMDLELPPPMMGVRFHRYIREHWGDCDPYADMKRRANQLALSLLPALRKQIKAAPDPLEAAVKIAIAGNMIDAGVHGDFIDAEVEQALSQAIETELLGGIDPFRRAIEEAESILYLADNAGEIVMDRLLLECLPVERVTLVVRGQAILNDATREDAEVAGIPDLCPVMDNGSDMPGTVLSECSAEMNARFNEADLILAKGQGNYETQSETTKAAFFLLKAKCPVIASDLHCDTGAMVLRGNEQALAFSKDCRIAMNQ